MVTVSSQFSEIPCSLLVQCKDCPRSIQGGAEHSPMEPVPLSPLYQAAAMELDHIGLSEGPSDQGQECLAVETCAIGHMQMHEIYLFECHPGNEAGKGKGEGKKLREG